MSDINAVKFKCESCIWLNTKHNGKTSCSDSGITIWHDPCSHFNPIVKNFPGTLGEIQKLIPQIERNQLPLINWMVDKILSQEHLEKQTGFNIGETVMVRLQQNDWEEATIESITNEHFQGTTIRGTKFTALHKSVKKIEVTQVKADSEIA